MMLSWSGRRQLLYYAVAAVISVAVLFTAYEIFFTSAPTCFDGKQNGDELGVDCGGACARLCPAQARAPSVLWSRAFLVATSTYTAAAYIGNPNGGAGARNVAYSFQLFDANNLLIVERSGTIDLPPIQIVSIVEANINVGERVVARTLFSFSKAPVWNKTSPTNVPTISASGQQLNNNASQLSVIVSNNSLQDARSVVVAVLFDTAGIARAASKSVVDLGARSSQQIVFTWPGGVADIVRAEITVVPPF